MATQLELIKAAVTSGHLDAGAARAVESLVVLARTAADDIEDGNARPDDSVTALRAAADAVGGTQEERVATTEETDAAQLEQAGVGEDAVEWTVSGPSRLAVNEPGTWTVRASKAGHPVAGFGVFAQIGHGSGRPLREATDAQGEVEFEFAFRMPASTMVQFAAAGTGPANARFPSRASDVVVTHTLVE